MSDRLSQLVTCPDPCLECGDNPAPCLCDCHEGPGTIGPDRQPELSEQLVKVGGCRGYWVEVVAHFEDDERVERRIGPYSSERIADRAEDGVNRNLDHERYYTRLVHECNTEEWKANHEH